MNPLQKTQPDPTNEPPAPPVPGARESGGTDRPGTPAQNSDYYVMALLVDDQPLIGEAVRRQLTGHRDIDFHYCTDPADAISVADQIRPTVILQDLVMPNHNGLDMVTEWRRHPPTRSIPIIVLSTKEEARIKSDAFAAGANDYIVKLPDELELTARLRYHSRAFLNQMQRDEAYRALEESQQTLLNTNTQLTATNQSLQNALDQVKQLQGLLPICSYCNRIRDDKNYWQRLEAYLGKHDINVSHGICPDCLDEQTKEILKSAAHRPGC